MTIGDGVATGRQWMFQDVVVLDAFVVPGYNSGSIKVASGSDAENVPSVFNGFVSRTGIIPGIAF